MDEYISSFISSIKEKTGIEFSVFDSNGNFVAGKGKSGDKVNPDFEGIKLDKEKNKTLFHIKNKNVIRIGAIEGTGDTQKNYAILIGELVEKWFFRENGISQHDFCRAILLGETNQFQIARYMRKYSMEDRPAFVMLINAKKSSVKDVKDVLKTYGTDGLDFVVEIDESQIAFVKFVDDQTEEYQSSTEYAEFLQQSIYEEAGVNVKIAIGGTVNTIAELSHSFGQAMATIRMSSAIKAKGYIHSYKEYTLIKMLEDLPKYKLNEYLETLVDGNAKEIFLDEEMTNTAEEFLENSLNISETSRKLYLHRNTLTYRLDKIEKATGLNIRKFTDAVTFRLITILSKLVK